MILGKTKLYGWWKTSASHYWRRRRFEKLMRLLPLPDRRLRVLEVGCGDGKDILQFMAGNPRYELWAVDILPRAFAQDSIQFVQADGAALPFADSSFDLVITVGVLEHIEPMEKLCAMIGELDRVGRHQISVVPSLASWMEPHCGALRWPLRLHRDMLGEQAEGLRLNYFSEHTWSKFYGFRNCHICRLFYLPPLIRNTVIYR